MTQMTATERRELLPCTCDAWKTSGYSSNAFPSHDWKGCPFCLTPLRVKEPEYPTLPLDADREVWFEGDTLFTKAAGGKRAKPYTGPSIYDRAQCIVLGTLAGMVMPRAEPTYTVEELRRIREFVESEKEGAVRKQELGGQR